jgi:hypothetical protein
MLERRRSFQGSSRCSATPQTVWAVWTNAAEWQGDVVEAVKIEGDFVVGAKYTTKVKGYPPLTSTVIRIDPLRAWVAVANRPGVTMTMEHVIEPNDLGTLVVERVIMSGPAAGLYAGLLGKRLESLLGVTSAHVARLAEAHPST